MATSLERLASALTAHEFTLAAATFDGRPVTVGTRSEFRWSWMATRLHTFVLATAFDADVDEETLDRFLASACQYAVRHKGGLPRGLQTGSAAVAVAVVEAESATVVNWASRMHGRRFAAIPYPVAAITASGRVISPRRFAIGALYARHLAHVADEVVGPAVLAD